LNSLYWRSKVIPRVRRVYHRFALALQSPFKRRLSAFYELGEFPASYDIVFMLVAAQARALSKQIETVHFYLVNGQDEGLRVEEEDYGAAYPVHQRNYVVSHVVETIPRLGVLCRRPAVRIDPREVGLVASQYRAYFSLWMENEWNPLNRVRREAHAAWRRYGSRIGLSASDGAVELMRGWLRANGIQSAPIVLTLRDRKWSHGRNSSGEGWKELAGLLKKRGVPSVVIPNTERVFERTMTDFCGLPVCVPASVDTELRLALCELARMNFTVNTGPGTMLLFSRAPYRFFTNLGSTKESSADLWSEIGVPPGSQLSEDHSRQRMIWEADTADVLLRELEEVLNLERPL
jgi:hypothetical protein